MTSFAELIARFEREHPEEMAAAREALKSNPLTHHDIITADITDIMLMHEINNLRSTISRLREYARHEDECAFMSGWTKDIHPCDCGYDALVAELEEGK